MVGALRSYDFAVAKSRSLRRLVPDDALLERRAGGESLRQIGADYGVAHSTLLRYFRRPDAVVGLEEAHLRVEAEQKSLAAQRAQERRLEKDVRKRAREQAARDRELDALLAALPHRSSDQLAWLDLHELPRDVVSTVNYSAHDRKALEVVASGGGVEQVIEATGLRSRENVFRLDAQIMSCALKNDARRLAANGPDTGSLDVGGLRTLVPDPDLLRRRAAGEPLRRLATDYDVSHTTLSRYFRRPEVANALDSERARRHRRPVITPPTDPSEHAILTEWTAKVRAEIRQIVCPVHGRRPTVRYEATPTRQARLAVKFCCEAARKESVRRLSGLDGALVWTTD